MIDNDNLPSGVKRPQPDVERQDTESDRPSDQPDSEPSEEAGAQVWHTTGSIAELSSGETTDLADTIYETMQSTRDETLEQIRREYDDAPTFAATKFEQVANSVLRKKLSRHIFIDEVRPFVEQLVDGDNSFSRSNSVRFFSQNIENATEDALEEMLRLMRIQVRRAANSGEEMDDVMARVESKYNDAKLRERAELIAYMETRNVEETIKLQQFENDPEVVGVRVANEEPSTPLTRSLSGAEVYFSEGDIQEQLMSQTREEFLYKGFDPLPATPPFHFNDTTRLEPIRD
jgi:hypothetical protein